MKRILLLAMIVAAIPHAGAQVYKCKGPAGETVYTETPCTPSAEPMRLRSTRASTITEGESANREAVFRSTETNDARIAETQCNAAAAESIQRPSDQRIAGYERQIRLLNAQAAQANNNLAGATYHAGLQTQISGLQQSIATERSSANSQMTAARTRCASARTAREEAIKQKYEADSKGHNGSGTVN